MTNYFHLNTRPDAVRAISTLGLAHLGDGVFELMVRSWLCLHGKASSPMSCGKIFSAALAWAGAAT